MVNSVTGEVRLLVGSPLKCCGVISGRLSAIGNEEHPNTKDKGEERLSKCRTRVIAGHGIPPLIRGPQSRSIFVSLSSVTRLSESSDPWLCVPTSQWVCLYRKEATTFVMLLKRSWSDLISFNH